MGNLYVIQTINAYGKQSSCEGLYTIATIEDAVKDLEREEADMIQI